MFVMKSTRMMIHFKFLLPIKLLHASLCKVYGSSPFCVHMNIYCLYCVVHFMFNLSRAAIHLGIHAHLVYDGKCMEPFKEMENMVAKEVLHMPNAMSSTMTLVVNKTFMFCFLFNENGQGIVELLKGDKFNETLLEYVPLCPPNIHNLISSIKHRLGNMGFIDSILMFKALSPSDYIHDSCFLDNRLGKRFIFSKCWSKGITMEFI